jgi:hypothetical protein
LLERYRFHTSWIASREKPETKPSTFGAGDPWIVKDEEEAIFDPELVYKSRLPSEQKRSSEKAPESWLLIKGLMCLILPRMMVVLASPYKIACVLNRSR